MNILVFGKDGQLGKAFKTIFDKNKLGELHYIQYVGRAECDLRDSEAIAKLLNRVKPDLVINAAAYTAVDKAETEVDLAYAINAKAPEVMAIYTKRHGATFLHYSTDYVFDGSKKTPYVESDIRNPLGSYGKSKAAGEEAIEGIFQANHHSNAEIRYSEEKAQYAILRTSWVYGDGGNFIRTILRLAKERETLKVIADQYGVPTSATWLAEISLALVLNEEQQLRQFSAGIYHAVPQGETTWHALARHAVQTAIDAGEVFKHSINGIEAISAANFPMIAPRPTNSRLDVKKLQHLFLERSDQPTIRLFNQLWNIQVTDYVSEYTKTHFHALTAAQ